MLRLLLVVLTTISVPALAETLRVECSGCTTLRDFGNFGAAALYRAVGPMGPAVGADRIWVENPGTGESVFVDLDTPISMLTVLYTQLPLPDLTRTEINATRADGSESQTWVLPNEVVAAIAESIGLAERRDTPEVTPEELDELPGFSPAAGGWHSDRAGGLWWGDWRFSVTGNVEWVPQIRIVECTWYWDCSS